MYISIKAIKFRTYCSESGAVTQCEACRTLFTFPISPPSSPHHPPNPLPPSPAQVKYIYVMLCKGHRVYIKTWDGQKNRKSW